MEYNKGNPLKEILKSKQVFYNNRGMNLENDINISNQHYIDTNQAFIYKKPTPIKIVKVDYPTKSNRAGKITIKEAYFEAPSTTDYNGLYKGKYIDFEAKECQSLTSFPLKSIHEHQIKHIENVCRHGAIAFVIIRFIKYNETYYVDAVTLINYIKTCTRSSVPYKWFQENGYLIPFHYNKPVDYLEVVDSLFFKE